MSQLERLDRSSWQDLVAAPVAVLMLAKTDCAACAEWTAELEAFLAADDRFADVRFGKLYLDQPGLIAFKRENPWVAEVDVLPFNVVYRDGQVQKRWAGSGVGRLVKRLEKVRAA